MAVRCVIVDDNEHFLAAARDALERDGVSVVGVARDGAEAVARVSETRPDVALVDVCLGEESGFTLAERLTAENTGRHPVVILVSTYSAADFDDMLEDSAACAFLSKSELSGTIVRELHERHTRHARTDSRS